MTATGARVASSRSGGAVGLMRRAAVVAVLAVPTALAFGSGGYFPRSWATVDSPPWGIIAGLVAWGLAAFAAFAAPHALPVRAPGRLAVVGLLALTGWTALSLAWAPLSAPGIAAVQRDLLYLGFLGAAAAWLRGPVLRWVEPALCAGVLVVIGYGLAERIVPGIFVFAHARTAAGRLDQPLTYWNAMGALAALGWVLALRLAGDAGRSPRLAAAAAAASVPLALGVWLSFSRGAVAAALAGAAVLVALDPVRRQLGVVATGAATAFPLLVAAELLPGVTDLSGGLGSRELSGLGLLAVLGVCAGGAVVGAHRARGRADADRPLPRALRRIGLGLAAVALVGVLVAVVAADRRPQVSNPAFGAKAARFGSADSFRYEYWRVALREWLDHPLVGEGAGAFAAAWLRDRRVDDSVRNAHSLYLETPAELGLVGLALLAVFLAGIARAVRAALRESGVAVGTAAGLVVYGVHCGLDWDWQMPAVTLVALALVGAAVGWSERAAPSRPSD